MAIITPNNVGTIPTHELEIASAELAKRKQEMAETLSDSIVSAEKSPEATKFPTPKIFEGRVQGKLTANMTEGTINFNGKKYTFVREEGISKAFEQMGIDIKDCVDEQEATTYFKKFFAKYVDQYPELFAIENWYSAPSDKMFPMVNQWAQDYNIPYVGLQWPNGGSNHIGTGVFAWLPVRVGKKFVFICSSSKDEEAGFRRGGIESYASLAVSFMH